jgi:phage-related protein
MALILGLPEMSYSPQETREPKVTTVKFDDMGYELRMSRGLNADLQTWEVPLNLLSIARADEIEGFLAHHGGVRWFWFQPPRQTAMKKFICKRWSREPVNGSRFHDRMSISLQEVVDISE